MIESHMVHLNLILFVIGRIDTQEYRGKIKKTTHETMLCVRLLGLGSEVVDRLITTSNLLSKLFILRFVLLRELIFCWWEGIEARNLICLFSLNVRFVCVVTLLTY